MAEEKLHLIAPTTNACIIGSCLALYSKGDKIIVVGKLLASQQLDRNVRARIGPDEAAVEIPLSIWREALALARATEETVAK